MLFQVLRLWLLVHLKERILFLGLAVTIDNRSTWNYASIIYAVTEININFDINIKKV